jgi:Transposase IS116/IS110/IS902 family
MAIGDTRRFDNPRQLMAYLGLVPGESSSGDIEIANGCGVPISADPDPTGQDRFMFYFRVLR